MPYKEKTIKKIYFSYGEVSERLGIPQSKIRYWDDEIGMIKKKNGNARRFTEKDIEWLVFFNNYGKYLNTELKKAIYNNQFILIPIRKTGSDILNERADVLLKFINWHNERDEEKYIPNSEIGKFLLDEK